MARIIDETEFIEITHRWKNCIDQIQPANMYDYFKNNKGEFLEGYKITFVEYLELINSVGTHLYKARFGLLQDESLNHPMFTLILWGVDKNGNETTGYLLLEASDMKFDEVVHTGKIADIIGQQRLAAWSAMGQSNRENVPLKLFKLDAYGGSSLQGYNYKPDDFFNIFAGFQNHKMEDVAVHFDFCCLSFDYQNNESQNGYFDLLISALILKEGTQSYEGSSFYDAGAPCPPLCNGGD
ncbi:MAG TPA: hypothetical protein DCS93_40870 [Microscillaceae bacterium]|nr:hypothetical protein [Microscillaceae bacterium]